MRKFRLGWHNRESAKPAEAKVQAEDPRKQLEPEASLLRLSAEALLEKLKMMQEKTEQPDSLDRFAATTKEFLLSWLRALPYVAVFCAFLAAGRALDRWWRTLGLSVDQYIGVSAVIAFLVVGSAIMAGITLFRRKSSGQTTS